MAITPNDPANFTPARGSYKELSPFRFWCQKVLPLVYDDSLSYYELLNKVVNYLNMAMEDVTTLEGDVTNLHTAYVQLQTYVNDYFVSLDVQEEINNKLNEMASDGSLSDLVEPFIPNLITDWLDEHITPTTPAIDDTLSVRGAGADSKTVGDFKKLCILNSYKVTSSSDLADLNNAPDNSIGYFQIPVSTPVENIPDNYPESSVIQGMGVLVTLNRINSTTAKLQYYFARNGVFWCREYAGTWQAWRKSVDDTLTLNVSANAKTVGDALIKKLNVNTNIIYSRNSFSDFNLAEENSVYGVNIASNTSPENIPLNYPEESVIPGVGVLCTFNHVSMKEQVYFALRTCKIWSRYYANNVWSAWYKESVEKTSVSYGEISDGEYTENLFNGTFSPNGGAVISGNTATITQTYQGMFSNEFVPETNSVRVKTTISTDLERVIVRLQYFNNNNWSTSPTLDELTSGVESNIVVPLENYTGSKYRVLIQSGNVASGSTKTLTVSNLEIYNESPLAQYKYYDEDFVPMMEKVFKGIDAEKNTFYVEKDGSGDFTSFVECINYINDNNLFNAVVHVGAGIFDLIDELGNDYINTASSTKMGLVLKNRVHVICSSQTVLEMKYSGTAQNVKEYLSALNAGVYGFTLENARIETENVRYSVHDDLGGAGSTPYTNRYINCTMIHKNGFYSDCIGGGLGENAQIEIRGCYFEGDIGRPRLAYYHGNNNNTVTNAQSRLIICDNYFAQDGTFKMTKYGQSTKVSTAYVSNNSFGSEPEVTTGSVAPYNNVAIVQWNNEIRNS